ncbi:casparian strip membrane protein 2-like [Arachis stenosperma]|uniref:casparian strip membrane protein 2-like n=1 Tax=Arachis stenosperma TaxID=217475 RepID=UPI0025AD1ACB|nr:casparian strip membrane protein 2-like [Arachis stenosperma]
MSTTIDVAESSHNNVSKGKATIVGTPKRPGGWKKGVSIMDFIVRLGALASTIGAIATMANADQSLPFFNQFVQFEASYDSFSAFQFFVITLALVSGYLVLSLPISIVAIVRPHAVGPRIFLIILDTIFLTLATSSAAAAASIVYLEHNGEQDPNWLAICNQYGTFCMQTSEAVISSFLTVVSFIIMIIINTLALGKH